MCTRDINLDDEAFAVDESQLALVLYNVSTSAKRFLLVILIGAFTVHLATQENLGPAHSSEVHDGVDWESVWCHRNHTPPPTTHHQCMLTDHANGAQLIREQSLREAIDTKYPTVKIRAAPDWIDQSEAMRSCLEAYPTPVEAWERNY